MTNAKKRIALVCPGGPITRELAQQTGQIAARAHGDAVNLHFHDQCFLTEGHFAGTDAERSAAFLEVANDPKYDAVWFARGGYGACRLDDELFTKLNDAARQKTYLGYSDAGVLLARLYKEGIGRPVHGPMPTDLPRDGGAAAIMRALDFLISGEKAALEPTAASGEKTIAFNITVLASLASAQWMPSFAGHVVILEDVGEYLYRIDRSMFAVMNAPFMRGAAGVKLGRFSDIPENDRPFGHTAQEIVNYWCARAGIAYLGDADIGHDADNKVVPFGAMAGKPTV